MKSRGWSFHSMISALRSWGKDLGSLPAMWRYTKQAAFCKPERGLLSNIKPASALILDLPAFRTVRNRCFVVEGLSHQVCGILLHHSLIYDTFHCLLVIFYHWAHSFFQFHLPVIWSYFSVFLVELSFWCDVFHPCYVEGLSSLGIFFYFICDKPCQNLVA